MSASALRWAPALGAALAAIAIYAGTWSHGFAWDDDYLIVDNPSVHSFEHAGEWFASPWASGSELDRGRQQNALYWRPLTQASYALDWWIGGGSPSAFHVTNTLLHALTCALLAWAFAAGLRRARPDWSAASLAAGATAAGVLFAVHPVHGEAVALATYRTTLLVGCLSIASMWLWVRSEPGPTRREQIAVWVLFAAALASKEDAAVLPGLLALIDWTLRGRRRGYALRFAPFAALLAAWWLIRHQITAPPMLNFFAAATGGEVALTMAKVYLLDWRLMVWPWPLTPFYDWTILPVATGLAEPEVLAGSLGFAAAVGGTVWGLWRGARVWPLFIGGFTLALLPYSHVLPFFDVAGERFLYVPALFVCSLVGVAMAATWGRQAALRAATTIAIALVTMVFATLSADRVPHFSSTRMLLAHTAEWFPSSFNAHYELARMAMADEDWPVAVEQARRAHALLPDLEVAALLVANALNGAGQPKAAQQFLANEIARLGPAAPHSYRQWSPRSPR